MVSPTDCFGGAFAMENMMVVELACLVCYDPWKASGSYLGAGTVKSYLLCFWRR